MQQCTRMWVNTSNMCCAQPHACGTNKQLTDLIFQSDSSIFVHVQCNNMRNFVTTKQYRTCCITAWQLENNDENDDAVLFFIEVLLLCKFSPLTRQQREDMFWGAIPHLGLIARRWDIAFSVLALGLVSAEVAFTTLTELQKEDCVVG